MESTRRELRAGVTLLEMMVVIALLGLLTAATVTVLVSMRRANVTGNAQLDLQREAERGLMRVVTDLRRSGSVRLAGKDYPYLFEDGVPDEAFGVHAHELALKGAQPSDYDFGANREVVLRLPADVTGPAGVADGVPDVDANGGLVWSANETSFVVVTRADGLNYLERRTNGGAPQRVCRYVERVVFDDALSSGFEVPLGAIRVRLYLRKRDGDGIVHRHWGEVTVRLQNG
jgi:prepilin-type N-terminal cleavage/methylation domain-containing protein